MGLKDLLRGKIGGMILHSWKGQILQLELVFNGYKSKQMLQAVSFP